MSSSTDTKASQQTDSKDTKKNEADKTSTVKDEKQSIKIKESKFNELINWLNKWGYKTTDKSKEINIEGIEYRAEISPPIPYSSGSNTPIFLEFQNDLDDGFIIRTTFELDKKIEEDLKNQNKAREKELIYIEIEQLILPLKVSMIKAHPQANFYKVIFYEDLNKQYVFDSINDLINSMTLVIGKWNEKYFDQSPDNNAENKPS